MVLNPLGGFNVPGSSDYFDYVLCTEVRQMAYEPRAGDVYIGLYEGREMRFYYGGTERTQDGFHVPVVYFAQGEIGERVETRHARNIRPLNGVGNIRVGPWEEILGIPSNQRESRLEDLLKATQEKSKSTGFSLRRLLGLN